MDNQETNTKSKYRLIRIDDGKIMHGEMVFWVSWDENGYSKKMDEEPTIGKSLILDPMMYGNYKWMTTSITEITKQQDDFIKFKTQNSTYELQIINK